MNGAVLLLFLVVAGLFLLLRRSQRRRSTAATREDAQIARLDALASEMTSVNPDDALVFDAPPTTGPTPVDWAREMRTLNRWTNGEAA